MEQSSTKPDPVTELASLILPVGQDDVDAFFNIGVRLYKSALYESASKFFLFLCMARPLDTKYLCAYGKSRKMMRDFKLAGSVFQIAFFLDKSSSEYAVRAAECLLLSGKKTEAKSLLEIAVRDPVLVASHPNIHRKANAWLDLISANESAKK